LNIGELISEIIATYVDFYDAGHVKWIEASSKEKFEKLMDLYGDDTFRKLMKKVEKYSV
jgi:hypothetical protein